MDATERDLTGLDVDRPLPAALRDRLEAALLRDAAARPAVDDETAALLGGLDRPLPLPAATRRVLEQVLIRPRRNRWLVPVAAAAAVLLVLASVAALNNEWGTGRATIAAGPSTTSEPELDRPIAPVPSPSTVAAPAGPTAATAPAGTTPCQTGCGESAAAFSAGRAAAPNPAAASSEPHPPSVSSVEPAGGPMSGGTTVTVRGAGFSGATGVRFGTSAALDVTVVSDGEIRAVSPPATQPGAASVVVTFPDGSQTPPGAAGQFTYTAP
jgi:hypothetical protein